jgi:hypothetical protein
MIIVGTWENIIHFKLFKSSQFIVLVNFFLAKQLYLYSFCINISYSESL